MPTIQYTPAQQAAINYRAGNLLLSAAAGSGKTAALTARIGRLISDGDASLSEMLVVTYTRAAAAEMKERIGKRLAGALESARRLGDRLAASRAAAAIGELPRARVSTIHSFLYQSLRPYFPALGMAPDARILDEKAAAALRRDIMRDVVDDAFRSPGTPTPGCASFTELADIIGQARDADAIDAELLWLANRLASSADGCAVLDRSADTLERVARGEGDVLSTPYGAEIRKAVKSFAAHYLHIFEDLAPALAVSPKVEKQYGPVCAELTDWLEKTRRLADEGIYEALSAHVAAYKFGRLPVVQDKDATEASLAFRFFRNEMKKALDGMKKDLLADRGPEIVQCAGMTARVLRRASVVLRRFEDRLAARKRDLAAIDYGDLESCALRLFLDENGQPTRTAAEIGSAFRYLFIDEYQDTNDVQDRIFRALSQNAALFMVGDIKQSIYRFRGADPSVFSGYRERWPVIPPEDCADAAPLTGEAGRSLFMSENFRCAAPIVRLCNAVSETILPWGGIPYEDGDALIHARGDDPDPAPDTELILIENPRRKPGEDEDEEDEDGALDREAEAVADRIASMVGRYGPNGRILEAGDVAILLRANRSAPVFRDALARRGIPAVMKSARPLGSYPSVLLLVCLLRFVDNPLSDIPTAGALRSPVFSIPADGLIAIREAAGDLPLYVGVAELAAREDSPWSEPCRRVADWLKKEQAAARSLPADRAVEAILRDTDFLALDGIRGNGAELDAIHRFCLAARTYESGVGGRIGGISGLLESLEETLGAAEETGFVKQADAVSILSIHASKGLEFPVCFLAECGKRRNLDDEKRTVLYDPALGLGMTLPDPGGVARCDNFVRKSIAQKIARESVDEEMRMLYVALTRAQNALILTAKSQNPDALLSEAELQAAYADDYRAHHAGTYVRWVAEAMAKAGLPDAKITVVYVKPQDDEQQIPETDTAPDAVTVQNETKAPVPLPDPSLFEGRFARALGDRGDPLLRRIPSKLTVSRLNPEILDGEGGGVTLSLDAPGEDPTAAEPASDGTPPAPRRPAFLSGGKQATAAERGSATHVFLQFVDYRRLREEGVEREIERLIRERYLSAESAALIQRRQIERFRDSALLDELLRSDFVKREFRFNVLLPAERFTADPRLADRLRERGIKITVQGVVDCVYRHPDTGRLVLVDYKTDALTSEEWKNPALGEEKLRRRHRNQLAYYREICEAMFGEEISEAVLYSTVLGKCFS